MNDTVVEALLALSKKLRGNIVFHQKFHGDGTQKYVSIVVVVILDAIIMTTGTSCRLLVKFLLTTVTQSSSSSVEEHRAQMGMLEKRDTDTSPKIVNVNPIRGHICTL